MVCLRPERAPTPKVAVERMWISEGEVVTGRIGREDRLRGEVEEEEEEEDEEEEEEEEDEVVKDSKTTVLSSFTCSALSPSSSVNGMASSRMKESIAASDSSRFIRI